MARNCRPGWAPPQKTYAARLAERYPDGVPAGTVLGDPGQPARPGQDATTPDGSMLIVPAITRPVGGRQAIIAVVAITANGMVIASSAPFRYPGASGSQRAPRPGYRRDHGRQHHQAGQRVHQVRQRALDSRASGLIGASKPAASEPVAVAKAPEPARAARLTRAQVSAALKRAGRRNITERATVVLAALRSEQLGQPEALTAAYAVTVRALVAVIITLNEQVKALEQQVRDHFGRHPDAEVILSQPGMGPVLGARVLAESGDDPRRYADGKARRNYAGTSPVTRASGKRKVVAARFVHNDRLVDALHAQAFSALTASPGARAFYDQQRANGHGHNDALRRLANRLVGILHGCLKTRTCYDEDTAWAHRQQTQQAA
jgi:hypothetical protein